MATTPTLRPVPEPSVRMRSARATTPQPKPRFIGAQEPSLEASTSVERIFAEIYNEVYDEAFAYAMSVVEDEEIAKDMVGQVTLETWERLQSGEPGEANAKLFIRLLTFRLRDHERRGARSVELTPALEFELSSRDELPQVTHGVPTEHDRALDIIWSAVGQMPPRRKEVFLMARVQELTAKEIAERLGISAKTVPVHLRIAKADVEREFERAGYRLTAATAKELLPPPSVKGLLPTETQERAND